MRKETLIWGYQTSTTKDKKQIGNAKKEAKDSHPTFDHVLPHEPCSCS